MKRKIFTVLIATLLILIIYFSIEVFYARSHTIEMANKYLSSAQITKQDLSTEQLEILIKIEDPKFFNHKGVDFITPGGGWTTITQALAKKFYFKNFKQGLPKFKQTLCARFALHPLVSKDQQITLFLNMMNFGNNQIGIVNAANYYYSKTVNQLSRNEYITLIASLISPSSLNIKTNPNENKLRVERINKMLSGQYNPKSLFDITYDKY